MIRLIVVGLLVALSGSRATAEETPTLESVREHLQKGRYDEALEVFDALEQEEADAVEIVLGRSKAYQAQGKWKKATEVLQAGVKAEPKAPLLRARLAEVLFRQGRYAQAEEHAEKALQQQDDLPLARLVQADIYTETGRIPRALLGYRWFVRYYNRVQPEDAESLVLTAYGAAQYARWKRVSQIFGFAVNTLCADALKNNKAYWQAYYVSGSLLLEKYNRGQALPEFRKALAINPRAGAVLVAMGAASLQERKLKEADEFADRALDVDPRMVAALQLKADIKLAGGNISAARMLCEQALEINPHEQRTLARLAACYLLEDGLPAVEEWEKLLTNLDAIDQVTIENPGRLSRLMIALAKRNPHPGYFLSELGHAMEQQRRFAVAERIYQQAITTMPELAEPQTALGMLYMQIGKTAEAEKILDAAFSADPYHVRVSNMRKVLRLLNGYETITTDHFVIRIDSEQDKILAQYMAEYLEEIYGDLVKQYGYEPPQRTQFEIYHNAKGLSAHQWFSARMVGLPWIQTVGASTGVIVALASPTATDRSFNWARVLKHEFVHVITLQQTRFHIPHWFTEALAVQAEGYPRPQEWNEMLLKRVPQGDLRTLKNLNDGFSRPESPADWQFAYCQSRLYAQYMVEKYGAETIPKLLAEYRDNVPTEQAIPRVCGVEMDEFEARYRKYLDDLVENLVGGAQRKKRTLAALEEAYRTNPSDTKSAGEFAFALFENRERIKARQVAEEVLKKDESEPLAALVVAEMELLSQDLGEAMQYLEKALDRDHPHLQVLKRLASLKLFKREYAEAAELFELGRRKFPYEIDFSRRLSTAYQKLDRTTQLKEVLIDLAARDGDDGESRKLLAKIFLDEEQFSQAVRYGRQALQVDVLDVDTHRVLGAAYGELKDLKRSAREYGVAVTLSPQNDELILTLARTLISAGRKEEARAHLRGMIERNPEHRAARELMQQVKGEN